MLTEINFDGIVGPSHNYAGRSPGNLAATAHAGKTSHPRAAALQGLAKMRHNLSLGLAQGFFVPPPRPNLAFLSALGEPGNDGVLGAAAWSASAMWAANAATVSPPPDTADGRCHLTPANLVTMPHRAHEWPDTLRQLRLAFADPAHFAIHDPVPPCFGDEGAANHMRLAPAHDAPGLEVFVYGRVGAPFPARQHEQASRAVARLHGLDPARVLFVAQSSEAIAAGAFHNDVVAVSNEHVLLVHEQAFAEPDATYAAIRAHLPEAEIIVVPSAEVSLAEAVRSYLFNAQLVTLDRDGMALIVPGEALASAAVSRWLDRLLAGNGPIRQVLPVDVRESMANGGGPACLRLRVVADPARVDPRFLLDPAKAEVIERVIAAHWPEQIATGEIGDAGLAQAVLDSRRVLLDALDLAELA
jgi:succinylarginine dihydrolase